jgi:hypothetical protein
MAKLMIGDDILGVDAKGKVTYTAVRAWMHRDVHADTDMRKLVTEAGTVTSSPRHSLATRDASETVYQFAADISVGTKLVHTSGRDIEVRGMVHASGHGLYAPLTWTSNYFVGDSTMDGGILAHSFAELRNPEAFQGPWHLLLHVAEFIYPLVNHISDGQKDVYVHPIAKIFMHLMRWSTPGYTPESQKVVV